MPWIEIKDYRTGGWEKNADKDARSLHYCRELEQGQILFFSQPPFQLPPEDSSYLMSQPQKDSRLHKNISYRPETDLMRGFGGGREDEKRVRGIMRNYAAQVTAFVGAFLAPYASKLQRDYASFRPLEEEGRDLPLHKRNDLLHVDAFPSRPTRGGRILRVFTNLNPYKGRLWLTGQRFPALAERYAKTAGLEKIAASGMRRGVMHALHAIGVPGPDRSAYDEFMLQFHDYLKENTEFQQSGDKEQIEFPSMATWLVFTDGVPHAALSGQYAMEQTFIVPVEALVSREDAPIAVLERLTGRRMA